MENQQAIFEKFARDRNITVAEMKAIIADRIAVGWNDPDPEKRAQWRRIPCEGELPTPEEWLQYVIKRLQEEGMDDLLRD